MRHPGAVGLKGVKLGCRRIWWKSPDKELPRVDAVLLTRSSSASLVAYKFRARSEL